MPRVLFATHNSAKARLFAPAFASDGFELITLNELPDLPAPEQEQASNALANALAKARQYHSPAYPWVFGDDAGLEIDALNGEPGLQARRWGGHFTDEVDDQIWLDYLLFRMRNVPAGKRTARFVSGWALVTPDGQAYTRVIAWPFEIAEHPIRPMVPGSPISAVRLGPNDDLASRQKEILHAWQQWGILAKWRMESKSL